MITLKSIIFSGMDIIPIDVQIQISNGLARPEFNIIGLADRAVKESAERVRNALSSLNLTLPTKRLTVNLSPSDIEKSGSHFDLPILCGILTAIGILPEKELSNYVIAGEIGLDGTISKINGVLPISVWAKNNKLGIICPFEQGSEARLAGHENILAPRHIIELINHFKNKQFLSIPTIIEQKYEENFKFDLSEVKGQNSAKRALEIAAAGGHGMLMIGPPGSGKTMLASRIITIMPEMTSEEILESSIIYSIAGQLDSKSLITKRPFRSVHHTASQISLSGGGTYAKPGEISLAHNGILFLDELPEFSRATLEILRQPMESGKIMISRAKNTSVYPAKFQLIAAMNPCPCGYLGDAKRSCTKAPRCAEAYQNKISGPLLDRIDLHVEVDAVNPWDLAKEDEKIETSSEIKARVVKARNKQIRRQGKVNAELDGNELDKVVNFSKELTEFLNDIAKNMGLSARGYNRVKRLARTIADLEDLNEITKDHVAEAISYRPINRGKYSTNL